MEFCNRTYQFGDFRLNERANFIGMRLWRCSKASFAKIFDRYSELEAFYRFVNNPRVDLKSLTAPLYAESQEQLRVEGEKAVLVLHDTTVIKLESVDEVEGFGEAAEFRAHFSLAVRSFEDKRILGLMGLKLWTRENRQKKRAGKQSSAKVQLDPKRESVRWIEQVKASEQVHENSGRLIHIMDREADAYWLYEELLQSGYRFIIRMIGDRPIFGSDKKETIGNILDDAPVVFTRDVAVGKRQAGSAPRMQKYNPSRQQRSAQLSVRACRAEVKRSSSADKKCREMLPLNIVEVVELNPPECEKAIHWRLATSEPIQSQEDLERVVDSYRARWIIEEFFKALKTGCRFEQRQFESAEPWYNCLGLFIPVAIKIYNMREMAKRNPKAEETFLNPVQKKILLARQKPNYPETAESFLLAIAHLLGHGFLDAT